MDLCLITLFLNMASLQYWLWYSICLFIISFLFKICFTFQQQKMLCILYVFAMYMHSHISTLVYIFVQCGFFRRAKHEEIKQKREELANLADNGVSPDGGDGTNL